MLDRVAFFNAIRKAPFAGSMRHSQVNGINFILNEWERRGLTDLRWLAYMLGTTFWETARTMEPIAEYGRGRGRTYGEPAANGHTYYGRGYVQLTWLKNYQTMSDLLEIDLVNHPDRALDPQTAAKILFAGMLQGKFTGKRLSQYFGPGISDWTGARRIINGTDKAEEIAKISRQFYSALLAAQAPGAPLDYEKIDHPKPKSTKTGATISTTAGAGAGAAAQQAGLPWWAVLLIAVAVGCLAFAIWKLRK